MSTVAQIAANQANAALSTGPLTAEGKARVGLNAVKHGLTATRLVVREDEREAFETFHAALLDELAPQGPAEQITFDDLLHAAWNLERFRRLESEVPLGSIEDLTDPQTAATLDRLGRYQSRAQRAWYRALKELRVLQTNRALRALKLNEEAGDAVPAITAINDLTKQTQSEVTAKAIDLAARMVTYETGMYQLKSLKAAESKPAPKPAAQPKPAPKPTQKEEELPLACRL